MKVISRHDDGGATVDLEKDELLMLYSLLVETSNGPITISDIEWESYIAIDRNVADQLLETLRTLFPDSGE